MAMIDVSGKPEIFREATATGTIKLRFKTIDLIKRDKVEKGNPCNAAKIAGVLAAKRTSELIPLCHPLPLASVGVEVRIEQANTIRIISTVKARAQTGVEMEALTATTAALLTIWDMVKQYEKDSNGQYPSTSITDIHVVRKVKGGHER